MSSSDPAGVRARIREELADSQLAQSYVRIERRGEMEDIEGFVLGAGAEWALVASITEGREPNGFEVVRIKHVKRVETLKARDSVERRILQARGQWPLSSIDVDLDHTGALLDGLGALYPVLMFHTEKKWPDMAWVGAVCRREDKRTWYHPLDAQAQWLPELESFTTGRLTRITAGGDYVAGLVLVAGARPGLAPAALVAAPAPDSTMREVERTVSISHDTEADAGYISLRAEDDSVRYPTQIVVEDERLDAMVVLDLTASGQLGGIEVIGVSPLLDGLLPEVLQLDR